MVYIGSAAMVVNHIVHYDFNILDNKTGNTLLLCPDIFGNACTKEMIVLLLCCIEIDWKTNVYWMFGPHFCQFSEECYLLDYTNIYISW